MGFRFALMGHVGMAPVMMVQGFAAWHFAAAAVQNSRFGDLCQDPVFGFSDMNRQIVGYSDYTWVATFLDLTPERSYR